MSLLEEGWSRGGWHRVVWICSSCPASHWARFLSLARCIMLLLLLVVLGIVTIIVLRILKTKGVILPGPSGRRLLWQDNSTIRMAAAATDEWW